MSKTALMILAQGADETETITTLYMLRIAGVKVTFSGLDGKSPVLGSRQVTLVPDKSLADALAEKPLYDAIVLPGGFEGAERLCKSDVVAPTALSAHGVAKGKRITSYPTVRDKISSDYIYVEGEKVVVDGKIVTSRGPGTTFWFSLTLIEMLIGKEKADEMAQAMFIS